MFGLALWDRDEGRLLLARDRSGIKPLHYAFAGGRLYFGSEIKSLLAAVRRFLRDPHVVRFPDRAIPENFPFFWRRLLALHLLN